MYIPTRKREMREYDLLKCILVYRQLQACYIESDIKCEDIYMHIHEMMHTCTSKYMINGMCEHVA
jgi:hypothetical protein